MREWTVVEAARRDLRRQAGIIAKLGNGRLARHMDNTARTLFSKWEAGKLDIPRMARSIGMVRDAEGRQSSALPSLSFAAADEEIRNVAKEAAHACEMRVWDLVQKLRAFHVTERAWKSCLEVCARLEVEPPTLRKDSGGVYVYGPALARLSCPKWWRRSLRRVVLRRIETLAVQRGEVSRFGQVYCSDRCLSRRRAAQRRNAELMQRMQAVNELGQVYSLAELAELGVSNPVLRRAELMTRVKGLELIAKDRGDIGEFVTLTLPSRFHRVLSTGKLNGSYDGISTPADGQEFLGRVWGRVRAALAKRGVSLYGMRVAEPHHDGTPHWHLLVFADPGSMRDVRAVLRAHALAEAPTELGASKHRIKFERIDSAKGSAVAYVAKYLAKNVDGFQLEIALERGADGGLKMNSDSPKTAAERIRAWASAWGIRQFQFFGEPPVTWWRELRRVGDVHCDVPAIEQARQAADAGDYASYAMAAGGVAKRKCDRPLATLYAEPEMAKASRYGDQGARRVEGVEATAVAGRLITRRHTWVIIQEVAVSPPWTRVNNCNHAGGIDLDAMPPGRNTARSGPH